MTATLGGQARRPGPLRPTWSSAGSPHCHSWTGPADNVPALRTRAVHPLSPPPRVGCALRAWMWQQAVRELGPGRPADPGALVSARAALPYAQGPGTAPLSLVLPEAQDAPCGRGPWDPNLTHGPPPPSSQQVRAGRTPSLELPSDDAPCPVPGRPARTPEPAASDVPGGGGCARQQGGGTKAERKSHVRNSTPRTQGWGAGVPALPEGVQEAKPLSGLSPALGLCRESLRLGH